MPTVLEVAWEETAIFLVRERRENLPVVAARRLGARHILTTNPRDFRPFGHETLP